MIELNKIYNEPCLETLRRMPNDFLDCVITSPPYWQLRDYGYPGQWGLEPTFNEYLENLWSLMDEIFRVLKPAGTVWVNLGDTYVTQSGSFRGKNTFDPKNKNATISIIEQPKTIHKCLLLIPHRFAIGCIERGWIIRNDIIWAKRNGMPESVTDRFSKKHEYFFFMVKSEKYFFDLDSIRDKFLTNVEFDGPLSKQFTSQAGRIDSPNRWQSKEKYSNEKGKNPGDVSDFWDVPTKPNRESHYAQYSDDLIKKPILAGCPEGGIIYDPFMGSGSTAEAAIRANRKFIGSEMSTNYIEICNQRLKPYLSQTTLF